MPAGRTGAGDVVAGPLAVGSPVVDVVLVHASRKIESEARSDRATIGSLVCAGVAGRYDARVISARPASTSQVTLTQLMEVTDANILGNVHGGVLMRLADTAAGLAAFRHAQGPCVTVSVDEMAFLEPVHVGDLVTVQACVNDVGRTSLECGVRIEAEDPVHGMRVHASSAYFVFVALGEDGRPRIVPPIVCDTEEGERRQREAKLRRRTRMAHKAALEAHRGTNPPGA